VPPVRGAEATPKKRTIPAAQRAAREANEARADERARKLGPIIKAIQAKGITSLNGIAEALSDRRVPTARGLRRWYAPQVQRLLARLTK
jgi:DNA-binding protein H-NS